MPKPAFDISESLEKVRASKEFLLKTLEEEPGKLQELLDKINKWFKELKESIADWFNNLFPHLSINDQPIGDQLINIIAIVLMAIFVILLVYTLYRLLEHYRRKEKEELKATISVINGQLDSSSWFDLAKNQAQKSKFRDACRSLYMALLFYMDENGIIKYDTAKTNLEYLQNVRGRDNLYVPLRNIINIFEYLWYGKQPGTSDDYNDCLNLYNKVTNE